MLIQCNMHIRENVNKVTGHTCMVDEGTCMVDEGTQIFFLPGTCIHNNTTMKIKNNSANIDQY
jgi:hypothetical protein